MRLNHGTEWLVPCVCIAAILCGCGKWEKTAQVSLPADPKSQIFAHLNSKTRQKNFTPGIDLDLPKHVTTLQSNAMRLEQRTIALRASLRATDGEQTPLEKEIEKLRAEVATAKRAAGDARARLNEAEARAPRDRNEVDALQRERSAKEAAWTAKRAELSAKDAPLEAERAARKQKLAALEQELQEAERALEVARVEAGRKSGELSRQEDDYIRAVRQQMEAVPNYETLYRLIGQQLVTADRLLADPDISRRRLGLKIAREACGHAMSDSVDVWLAARICEAYFWPNLDLADAQPGSREGALDLLERSRRVFFDTLETNNVLKNYQLQVAIAPSPRAADTFRLQLADWLEEKGDMKRAAEVLNEIRDAQVLESAQERITRVRQHVASTQ